MNLSRTTLLVVPVVGFLLIFFFVPMIWFASLAVREVEVPRALPQTVAALRDWKPGQTPPTVVFDALASDLKTARSSGTLAEAAHRINYEVPGVRSLLLRAGRTVARAPAETTFDAAYFTSIDPLLTSDAFLSVVKRAGGGISDYYILSSLDLQRTTDGAIAQAPAENRLYLDVLARTIKIAATVTLCCLLMGFPVAVLLTTVSEKAADWLMILVLLPFWTSLLVRTTAWVVLLQREGLINSLLMKIGVISEPLAMIYNRTGVIIAMTHVLLPFMILPLYGAVRAIPPGYMRAAASLGARPLTAFIRIYLPLAAPGIAAGSLMVFILSLGYYITPSLVGGASDQMLSYFVATYTTGTGNWGLASALGLLLLASTFLLYLVAHRLSGGRAISLS
ncbi:ABC transporter permease [Mesorhizobium sp. 1M-11]|uniref:ABC transporter permease n=1 Tax=Mesorhizobium sp. 1M-11 TaxID=1529006 RepID=UPI0009EB590D|nr:ABC transporter permease [Mesorhizobium sp. 1M-11]